MYTLTHYRNSVRKKVEEYPRRYSAVLEVTSLNNLKFKTLWTELTFINTSNPLTCSHTRGELSREEIGFIFEKLDKWGVASIYLSGGEIFLLKDSLEIIAEARKRFFTQIITNSVLIDNHIAQYLSESRVVVTVYTPAVTKDPYEEMSQVEGSYSKFTRGAELLVQNGVEPLFLIPVTKPLIKSLDKTLENIQKLGVKRVKFTVYPGSGYGHNFKDELMLSPSENLYTTYRIEALKKKYEGLRIHHSFTAPYLPNNCMQITIDPRGRVMPCSYLRIIFGYALSDDFTGIYKKMFKQIAQKVGYASSKPPTDCQGCDLISPLYGRPCWGGCRCVAYNLYGRLNGPDRGCSYLVLRHEG